VRFHGATVHFVRHETDSGPIIAQSLVAVRPDDTEESLGARVLETEHRLYPLALRLIGKGQVRVEGERVVVSSDAKCPDNVLFNPMPQME
jgi:phosphoribosylglycinamide formyltransferase-1